ncbi:unnamed protein product [Ixodes persulcatus]
MHPGWSVRRHCCCWIQGRGGPVPAAKPAPPALPVLFLALLVLLPGFGAGQWMPRAFTCPPRAHVSPCLCLERSKGLDVTCERVDKTDRVRTALSGLADAQQTVLYLRLRHDRLDRFPPRLLDRLEILHLLVHHSNVSEIHLDAFRGVEEKLESLDLSQNALEEVPTEALQALTALVTLNLSYNRIQAVQAWAFRGLVSLLRLSLFGNRIVSLDPMAFQGVGGNLTRLNLGGNVLSQVPSESLQSISVLQQLLLHENRISELSPDRFPLVGSALDILNLADNRIVALPEGAFSGLGTLVSLDLERNGLAFIHPAAFVGVHTTMEWLKLGHNSLSAVPSEALQNLTALRELDLRDNNISYVHGDAFDGYGASLKFVYLQKNRVQSIEPGAFDRLHSLEWLYLHSNEISTLHYSVFRPVLDTLSILDVHDNPFHCDCDLSWLRLLLKGQGGNIVVNQPRETRCGSPDEFSKLAVLDIPSGRMHCGADSAVSTGPAGLVTVMLRTLSTAVALLGLALPLGLAGVS